MTFRESGCVCGFLGSHIDRPRMTADMSNKARGWLDHARSAHSHEHRAFVQSVEDAIQFKWFFTEPANVRANPPTALASGQLGWRIIGACVVKRWSAAPFAAALEEFAVHVDDAH